MKNNAVSSIEKMINPESIAVIGASRDPNSVGYGILKNLISNYKEEGRGQYKYEGKVFAINPNAKQILGIKCYEDILSVHEHIDLAIICVRAQIVNQVAWQCAKKGVKSIIVISAGFGEIGTAGRIMQEQLVKICKQHSMRMLGPNCLGVIRPSKTMNASFALTIPNPGQVAFISQSGAIADSVIDWAIEEKYTFSTIVSTGNSADLDAADWLDWLARDKQTKSIAMYVESIKNGRKFIKSAKKLKEKKPIILLKGGKTSQGQKAANSHTGALAGDYQVFFGAMKEAGVIIAESIEEMFDLARALCKQPKLQKNSIAIITNGGGVGVLCADYCSQFGLNLANLKKSTLNKLDKTKMMNPNYSKNNPLDIIGDARPLQYKAALETLIGENYISGILVIQTLQSMTDPVWDAKIVIEVHKKNPKKPIICVFMGGKYSHVGIRLLEQNNIVEFNEPRKAVKAMAALYGLV